jgi:hypothetical protein
VEFEWIGLGAPLEQDQPRTRGKHVTSSDALLVGVARGHLCAYLIEWKLSEEYEFRVWKGKGDSGNIRRNRYASLYNLSGSSFNGTIPLDDLLYEPHYQLLRLRLLGDRMVREKEFGISEAKLVVVCPEENTAYRTKITSDRLLRSLPDAQTVEDVMRSILRDQNGFVVTSPASLVAGIQQAGLGAPIDPWLRYQQDRYGW